MLYYDDPHLYDVAVNFRNFEQVRSRANESN